MHFVISSMDLGAEPSVSTIRFRLRYSAIFRFSVKDKFYCGCSDLLAAQQFN